MSGNFLKHSSTFDGSHSFLAEELLQPMASRVDSGRTNMFCAHFAQSVVLNDPERPRVFSRFENAVGRYSTAVRRAQGDTEVVSFFDKNDLQRVYALRRGDGRLDIHFAGPVRHLTESYGYALDNSGLRGAEAGHVVPGGAVLQTWPCDDPHGNLQYGRNLSTVYMNEQGETFEDGIVLSETAASALAHTTVRKVTVSLNANDLCVNLYGDHDRYRGFPDVGEMIEGGVLMARRRINHDSILHDLSADQLRRASPDSDQSIFCEGRVVDLDVFSNLDGDQLSKHTYNAQLARYFGRWREFQAWVVETFGPAVEGGGEYTEDAAFWYARMRDSQSLGWREEKSEFDGVILEFTIAKASPVEVGSKVSNRYGGKGVVSTIRRDSDMPVTECGKRADIIVNSLGIVNRLNPAQLFESELNFIADAVAGRIRDLPAGSDYEEAWELHQRFMQAASPDWAAHLEEHIGGDREAVASYLDEIIEGAPIYVHQPPFWGVVSLERMRDLYRDFGVEKLKFVGIEEPMVLGSVYYMKLRHEPSSKFSARSAKHLSIAGVPTRNNRGMRTHTEHHSSTPLRIGEQEIQNLHAGAPGSEIERFLATTSTDSVAREGTIRELLTRRDPFSQDVIDPPRSTVNQAVAGVNAYLEAIGLRLVGSPAGEAVTTAEETAIDRSDEQQPDQPPEG